MSIQNNYPSIEEIQISNDKNHIAISDDDINRLFTTSSLPQFQLGELKAHKQFAKYKLYLYFLEYLENWNKKISEKQQKLNIRTQQYCSQFIYSQLKRIVVSNNKNIQIALNHLYKWFEMNTKSDKLHNAFMPNNKKRKEPDEWEIRKTFKYNTTLQLQSYNNRKLFAPPTQIQNNFIQGSFITCPKSVLKIKNSDKIERATSYKLKQQQLRRIRQIKQIQEKEAEWKNKRTRFQEQTMKNFYRGNFNTTIRFLKSSNGARNQNKQFNSIKEARVQSTLKLRRTQYLRQPLKENVMIPESVNGAELIKNPLEVKAKGKGRNKKKKI